MLVYNRSLYCICVILKYVNLLMSMTDYHLCYYLDNSVRGKLSFYNRKPTSCSWEIVKLILETLSSLVWNLYKKVLEVFLMPYKLQVIFVLHYIYSYIFVIRMCHLVPYPLWVGRKLSKLPVSPATQPHRHQQHFPRLLRLLSSMFTIDMTPKLNALLSDRYKYWVCLVTAYYCWLYICCSIHATCNIILLLLFFIFFWCACV